MSTDTLTGQIQPELMAAALPIGGLEVARHSLSPRAAESTAVELLSADEVQTLLERPSLDYFRRLVVASCVEFSADDESGQLSESDFAPTYEVQNVPDSFERALYIPEVKVLVSELNDLAPFVSSEATELTVPALDLFPKDTAASGEAIRVCDLRAAAGIEVDKSSLALPQNRKLLEDRFVQDMAHVFTRSRFPSVRLAERINYSKSGADKLRTYWRILGTDDSVPTPGYVVKKTIVRLADCATEGGEDRLYKQLFGRGM